MKTRFILLNTSHAGNVGAAARAMKVMGFDDLMLVAPRWANVLRREETIQRASGALDVLNNAKIVATLDEALTDMTHLCATAMTPRDFGPPTRSPRVHFELLMQQVHPREQVYQPATGPAISASAGADAYRFHEKAGNHTEPETFPVVEGVAFLFGSERFGMTNDDVYRCHVALQIPTNPQFGSLNLAAALQVIAYEWRLAMGGFRPLSTAASGPTPGPPPAALADAKEVSGLLGHLEEALIGINFLDPASPKKLMPRLNQLFNRASLAKEEVHILRGVAKAVLEAVARAKP